MNVTLTIIDVTQEHVAPIVELERAAGGASVVALTRGDALTEALARGHHVIAAVAADGAVAGWAWFATDMGRGAEEVGHVFRVCVAPAHRRNGVASMLLAHVRTTLAGRGVRRLRATLPGDAAAARALFAAHGFAVDAVIMERTG